MSAEPAQAISAFKHVFVDNQRAKTLILLHGTGGNEHDLLPLVEPVASNFNILGLRGNVLENGMPRFFARKSLGVFDLENLAAESDKLAAFLTAWYAQQQMQTRDAIFIGFSNGANMALAILFRHPGVIQYAAFLHAMLPFEPPDLALEGKRFLVTHGLADTMIPNGEAERLAAALEARRAEVKIFTHAGGHEITCEEQAALVEFVKAL